MLIVATCSCGRQYRMKAEYAGRPVTCFGCGRVFRARGRKAELVARGQQHPVAAITERPISRKWAAAGIGAAALAAAVFLVVYGHLGAPLGLGADSAHAAAGAAGANKGEPSYLGKTVSQWTEQLKSPTWGDRLHAASALSELGRDAAPAAAALGQLLMADENRGGPRNFALKALGHLGPAAAPAVPGLIRVISDRKEWGIKDDQGLQALEDLAEIGPAAKASAPELKKLLADENETVRVHAACALARTDPSDAEAMAKVIEWLKSPTPAFRATAAQHLGEIGPDAKQALPALAELLKDPDGAVRVWATYAKAGVEGDPASAIPALKQAAIDVSKPIRTAAREALLELGIKMTGLIETPKPAAAPGGNETPK